MRKIIAIFLILIVVLTPVSGEYSAVYTEQTDYGTIYYNLLTGETVLHVNMFTDGLFVTGTITTTGTNSEIYYTLVMYGYVDEYATVSSLVGYESNVRVEVYIDNPYGEDYHTIEYQDLR